MSIEQGEHTFEVEVLISGDTLPGYAAGEALSAGEPVEITGDYEVSSAEDGGPLFGVAAYDVAEGEEVPVIAGDGQNEIRVEVSEVIEAGDELTADGLGTFKQAGAGDGKFAIANEGAASGEIVEARAVGQNGTEGE